MRIPYNLLRGKRSVCTILSQTLGLNIEATQEVLKSVNKSVNGSLLFQKTLKTKGELSVAISLRKQNSTHLI